MAEETSRFVRNLIGLVLGAIVVALAFLEAFSANASGDAPRPEATWVEHLEAADHALGGHDVRRALGSWSEAYRSARVARSWRGMLDVADAYVRIGDTLGLRREAMPKAREVYLAAFLGARRERALDGVLRLAESFAGLGDRDVAELCLREAERLAANDPAARAPIALSRQLVAELAGRAGSTSRNPLARLGPSADEP